MKRKIPLLIIAAILAGVLQTGCNASGSDPNIFVAFNADGTPYRWTWADGFTTFCLGSKYCVLYSSHTEPQASVHIGVPENVAAGITYYQNTPYFHFQYMDTTGTQYALNPGKNFSLTFSQWPGAGGYARGTFSGVLEDRTGVKGPITITNGTFSAWIFMNAN